MPATLIPTERVTNSILLIRHQRVLLDVDLATLYGVSTSVLNQAVRRNRARFPSDFMFQLSPGEAAILRSQTVISSSHGGRRTPPFAFTEQGVATLSTVLRSSRAIAVNIEVMRAFVKLRKLYDSHARLARKMDVLEQKYDGQFRRVFQAIRELMTPAIQPRRRIGFRQSQSRIQSHRT